MITKHIKDEILFLITDKNELHLQNARTFFDECMQAINSTTENINRVIVDLTNVQYIESSGINALVNIKKDLAVRKIKMALSNYTENIKTLLDVVGLFEYFQREDNFEESKTGHE